MKCFIVKDNFAHAVIRINIAGCIRIIAIGKRLIDVIVIEIVSLEGHPGVIVYRRLFLAAAISVIRHIVKFSAFFIVIIRVKPLVFIFRHSVFISAHFIDRIMDIIVLIIDNPISFPFRFISFARYLFTAFPADKISLNIENFFDPGPVCKRDLIKIKRSFVF